MPTTHTDALNELPRDPHIALLKQAVRMLSQGISFDAPEQDLTFSLARMPTYPRSGVCLGNVRQ